MFENEVPCVPPDTAGVRFIGRRQLFFAWEAVWAA